MILRFADCELDIDRQSLTRDGRQVPVEPQVFDLLRLLAGNPDRLVTRDEIVEVVWGGRIVSEGAISARIASARKAVGDDGTAQRVIRTVQRRGLQMAVPVTEDAPSAEPGPASPQPVATSRLRYFTAPTGSRLAYLVQGEGTPVVRVDAAGWNIEGEQTSPIWRETTEWLSAHHRQLRFSNMSLSEKEPDIPEISFEMFVADIEAVVETAGFDRFALLTESGGVHSALRYAARNPARVTRMVIHGGYVHGRSLRAGTDSGDDVFRKLIEQGWEQDTAQIGAALMLPYLPEGPFEAITDAARVFQMTTSREVELAMRDMVNEADSSAILPQVTCPVLVVHGRDDNVHPVSEARKLVDGLPDAELWLMDTANHLPVAGHRLWEEYQAGLLEFLARDAD